MQKSISQSSADELNKKFHHVLKTNPKLLEEIADASVCNDVAVRLYELRVRCNLTQKELADRLGVKQSNISRWEQPGYQGYKVKMLSKIMRTLGGKLKITLEPETDTRVTYISLKQTKFEQCQVVSPGGWYINSMITSINELKVVDIQTKGQGAAYANA